MECLDDNVVSEFVSGSLAATVLAKVETHLAGCRDCRTLVAAMAADAAADSNVATVPHEKLSPSQVTHLPKKNYTVGDRVGRYLVLSTLGTGGMGVVFSAYDPQLDRKVALKLLRSGLQITTTDAQKRLRREAQAIAQLSHPNVVAVYDVGATEDGDLYIAMEFVEGDTLTTWLKKYPRTWREIIDVFLQAGKGLVAAHGTGLLHRDFKPDNVLVGGDGRVRVTDFGLARSFMVDPESGRGPTPILANTLSSSLTATGTVLGTPRYMPPEQLVGPDIDARADQFSFCVALYEALYGQHPLPGATSVLMHEKGEKALPPPEGIKIPVAIGRAVTRGLERDRVKRWPTMALLMSELVPPPPASAKRYVFAAVATIAIASAGMAAVIGGRDTPTLPDSTDPGTTEVLVAEINRLRGEIRDLNREKEKILSQIPNTQDIATLQQQLEEKSLELIEKDKKIQQLVATIQQIKNPTQVRRPQNQASVVNSAVADVSLDGCFMEWGERLDENGLPHTEARLLTKMDILPNGIATDVATSGETSTVLKQCINEAMARQAYPHGPEILGVEVLIEWTPLMLNRSIKVVSHRPPPQKIDM
ncbi:MAG: protein kinase domain-containing protein [Kofleriaceae bacterium]